MYYFIYKTTNKINNKYYIGQHHTECIDDGYLGSGNVFLKALKKYGKDNFHREILEFADSPESLNELEKRYITMEDIQSDNCYNQMSGGGNGFIFSYDTKKKMSEAKKGKAPWNKGKKGWMSDEGRKKISELMKNNRYRRGTKNKIETLQKLSKAIKGRIWVTNGIDSKFVFASEIPEGYRKGRIMKSMRGVK